MTERATLPDAAAGGLRIVVLVPAYNEAATIRTVVERVIALRYPVIVVDDGSVDGTGQLLGDLPVLVVRNPRNLGKSRSLWIGFQRALAMEVDAVVTIDADGQHLPEDIPRLARAGAEHRHRVVIGARLDGVAAFPRARLLANRFANFWISWAAGYPIADSQSGFRLYPKGLLASLRPQECCLTSFTFESEVLISGARLGFHSIAVPIRAIYARGARASHFRPVRDIGRIVIMVARRLLRSGMNPAGLVHSLGRPMVIR